MSSAFDAAAVLRHARIAAIAYDPHQGRAATRLRDEAGLPEAVFLHAPDTGTEALIAWSGSEVVMAARGTEPTEGRDWLTDLDLRSGDLDPTAAGDGSVHAGFLAAWRSVSAGAEGAFSHGDRGGASAAGAGGAFSRVERGGASAAGAGGAFSRVERGGASAAGAVETLRQHRQQGRRLTLVGHSLGGAIAVLAAAEIGGDLDLVTFGAPRVGDRRFAAWLGSRIRHRRLVLGADLVPLVPFLSLDFLHDTPAIHLQRNGDVAHGVSRATEIRRRLAAIARGGGPIRDHDILAYIQALNCADVVESSS